MLKIAWSACYNHPLAEGHRFPMIKYDLIKEQLLYEGIITEENLFEPQELSLENLATCHDADYIKNVLNLALNPAEIRRLGFPLSSALVQRELCIMQGTLKACEFAFEYGAAMNIAGGTHHAFANKAEGFCLFNDFAIASSVLLKEKKASKIIIIDLDVHQGNGTASIFKNNSNVITFSMHGKNNFPFKKEISNLDIELEDGISDEIYLQKLEQGLNSILSEQVFDFAFYQSGVDILITDKLGKLKVSQSACLERDQLVFKHLKNKKIPVVTAMGGGYSIKIADIVNAHCNTFKTAIDTFF
jgi:acetoin utilization deacetylase AcuC-like enzyme